MHIQERNNTTLTTCTKMTEEVDRRHGMNGNSSSNGVSDDNSVQSSGPATSTGGRLKFFKHGKIILELATAADGARAGWVAVPCKTYWPPTSSGAAPSPVTPSTHSSLSTLSARQERATSLSVSDDNSSVQSSPWQRDHCWKQTSPRRGLSSELGLLYVRLGSLPAPLLRCAAARLKRRRPLCPAPVPLPPPPPPTNGEPDKPTALGKFKYLRNKAPAEPVALRVYKKTNKKAKRKDLAKIIDSLKERLPIPVNAKISALNCKQEPSMVSPRKRILREMEKVSLIEDPANKRSRARHPPTPLPGPSCAPDTPKLYNGSSQVRPHAPPSKPVSSYTINSILSMSEERTPSRSPDSHSVRKPASYSNVKTESPVSAHSPDSLTMKRPHAYACAKLDSPGSAASPDPSPSPEHYRRAAGPWGRSPPVLPMRPELDYYFEGYGQYPPMLLTPGPYMTYGAYAPVRAPPLWSMYATPPWPPINNYPMNSDHTPREDTSSEPLNLSKH